MNSPIKIFLADEHLIFLESLSLLLTTIPEIELVGVATNGEEVLQKMANTEIDILICEYMLPKIDSVELSFKLRELHPKVKVVILTARENAEEIRHAIQAGVKGFLSKKIGTDELKRAIIAIATEIIYYSPTILQILVQEPFSVNSSTNTAALSLREIEILKLIAQEMSGVEIAKKLNVSHYTVETHRKNLFRKIGVHTSYALIKYALLHHFIEQ